MARQRSSTKKAPPEIGLHMECVEEDLEPSQIAYYNKAEKEYNEVQSKLDNYVKKLKAEVVEKGENCMVLQINATPPPVALASPPPIPATTPTKTTRQTIQTPQNFQQVVGQGILTRSTANAAGNTYLVMDSRLGFMSTTRNRQPPPTNTVMVTTRAKSGMKKQAPSTPEPEIISTPRTRTRDKAKAQSPQTPQVTSPPIQPKPVFAVVAPATPTSTSSSNYKIKVNTKLPTPVKPTESSALGGLSAGANTSWKTSSDEAPSKSGADSREVIFNKVTGKTFPSLVVVARPHLKFKYFSQTNIAQERTALDAKVKGVLMYSSTNFIEWLIQQGLIRSEQYCPNHFGNDLKPVKLKLGMYSDVSKFPYSGGYVWISDCCPSQFVSVFSGSIFEGAPHPPTTLLKLIYHWACQTNVQNVVQWVKVDNLYLKNFYTSMRAVCTQAVHEKYKKMGGPKKKIEVGVISLGTTSQDGNKRQVKVEVLGVMDQDSKLVRLRAVEPLSDERSFKRRFVKILEPLEEWVNKDSAILTDFTVAKTALNSMGFHTVYQVTNESKYSNQNVMEYLRRIVPRMFQNTLSLLSRPIIQQFLDELVWREMWGPIPSQAFVNIIAHMAEQTKLDVAENFMVRLNKVASNPFKRWDYSVWKTIANTKSGGKVPQKVQTSQNETEQTPETPDTGTGIRTRKRTAEQLEASATPAKKVPKVVVKDKIKKEEKVSKKEKEPLEKVEESLKEGKQIPLGAYYYASKKGEEPTTVLPKGSFNVKCSVCNKKFTDNIVLMKHMILHCQTDPPLTIGLRKVHQCEYCFLGFNTLGAMKVHLEEVHFIVHNKTDSQFICHICEEKFKTKHDLIGHMHKTHVEHEMPYECGVCRFRTSVYKIFVDHFIESHKGEGHVFCPYCLKVVTFSYKGEVITLNVLFFMSHLEKHLRLTLVKDCHRCQLSFIHKGILDQHLEADHESWQLESDVEVLEDLSRGLLMPEPVDAVKTTPPVKAHKLSKGRNMFTSTKFKSLELFGVEEGMTCLECEGFLTRPDHFVGVFNCLKCRFSSCCETSMIEHWVIFHDTPHPQFTKGKPTVLPNEMFCVCGYSTSSGNRIAKHLALCERKSGYPSKESAALALQPASKHKTEEKTKQGEGQNVLNMLGLVRKSPEAVTTGTESVKTEKKKESPSEHERKGKKVSQSESEISETTPTKPIDTEEPVVSSKSDIEEEKVTSEEDLESKTTTEVKKDEKEEEEVPMDVDESEKCEVDVKTEGHEVGTVEMKMEEDLTEEGDNKEDDARGEDPVDDEVVEKKCESEKEITESEKMEVDNEEEENVEIKEKENEETKEEETVEMEEEKNEGMKEKEIEEEEEKNEGMEEKEIEEEEEEDVSEETKEEKNEEAKDEIIEETKKEENEGAKEEVKEETVEEENEEGKEEVNEEAEEDEEENERAKEDINEEVEEEESEGAKEEVSEETKEDENDEGKKEVNEEAEEEENEGAKEVISEETREEENEGAKEEVNEEAEEKENEETLEDKSEETKDEENEEARDEENKETKEEENEETHEERSQEAKEEKIEETTEEEEKEKKEENTETKEGSWSM